MDFYTILVLAHIVGTILGVGGATIAEINVVRALGDGQMSEDERHLMHGTYTVIRIGTLTVLLSGIALVWWHVWGQGSTWPLTSAKVWLKEIMVVIITVNALLLTRRLMPLWLGSAISFVSWWGATVLGVWRHIPYSFVELAVGYCIAIFAVAGILELIRDRYTKKKR